jgi:hypothetical protein
VKIYAELWNTCFQVLSDNGGSGDFTKERHERPDLSAMDVERIVNMAKAEAVAAGRSM